MLTFILRRLLLLPLVVLGTTILIFALTQLLSPAMRASLFVRDANQMRDLPAIIRKYGLDRPFYEQYWTWLRGVLRGDLGYSFVARQTVAEAIRGYFPMTVELTVLSFGLIVGVGIWLGTLSAVHKDRWIDHFSRVLSIAGTGLPTFVWGLALLLVFYGILPWFPPGRLSLEADLFVHSDQFRRYTGMMTVDALLNRQWWIFWDALRHLVLPSLTLAYFIAAVLVRVTRSSMLETLRQDYVRTARAKGLDERTVIRKHARRNALIPVITLSSLVLVGLLSGAVITETIFDLPGIGRWGAQAAAQLDIAAVTGFALFVAVLTVLGNMAADILYALVDPRIRY
ncbi:MAG: ABC transporter permease [Armatimonadota bacterium]|nr:ABC transporter permease [Armatimonadota bacterium]MDR7401443.1 ABC transporter permease [Armatimonadota bacterium]MDR7404700.1 ABC transporter permease [Armatimonadota bacterium]MDR7437221.1 ABC transporter permease [Armatimonadota bacterium]MDR7473021.1 ABC transporter permease [Armatimonadota bacterium]